MLLGSQFITGMFGDKDLDTIGDPDGITLREILKDYLPTDACPAYRENNEILAVLELHDEQGSVLEAENIDISIVEKIVAISWLTVTVTGFAGHAGTVPMPLRQDAATGACRLISWIKSAGIEAGVALAPGPPVHSLEYVLDQCNFVTLMVSVKYLCSWPITSSMSNGLPT